MINGKNKRYVIKTEFKIIRCEINDTYTNDFDIIFMFHSHKSIQAHATKRFLIIQK